MNSVPMKDTENNHTIVTCNYIGDFIVRGLLAHVGYCCICTSFIISCDLSHEQAYIRAEERSEKIQCSKYPNKAFAGAVFKAGCLVNKRLPECADMKDCSSPGRFDVFLVLRGLVVKTMQKY